MDEWSGRGGQLNHSRSNCHAKYATAQPLGSRKLQLNGTAAWAGRTLSSFSYNGYGIYIIYGEYQSAVGCHGSSFLL